MSAFRACPFCGGEKISTGHIRDGRSCCCTECGASVRAYQPDAEQKCQDLWNTRSSADAAALQAQLDATNEGAWEYERQLHAALKGLQEIADMHVGDQPAAIDIPEIDWVKRHVGIMRHLASTAVKAIVADEGAKPKPVDLTAELLAALEGIRWMAEEWYKYSGSDATCADEYRRDLDRADAAIAKAGAQ